jgi:hypothetical protein
MVHDVHFDETSPFDPIPQPLSRPVTVGDVFFRTGIISAPGDAVFILAFFAVALIGFSFYIIASAVPPVSELGPDTLLPGEVVPGYVRSYE